MPWAGRATCVLTGQREGEFACGDVGAAARWWLRIDTSDAAGIDSAELVGRFAFDVGVLFVGMFEGEGILPFVRG